MNTVKPFQDYLCKFIDISDDEFNEHLLPVITVRKFDKKELLTKAGEIENYFNFILKGLIRKYYVKGKEEINTQVSFEGHIIHSQESFHSHTPSDYFVEAIEPSIVASITYKDLESIFCIFQKNGTPGPVSYYPYYDDKRPLAGTIGKDDTTGKVPEFCN